MSLMDNKRKELADLLIDQMKKGTAPWQKPWSGSNLIPYNPTSNKEYQGGNFIALSARGFDDPRWCTFNQAKTKGYSIMKGAKAGYVEYWQFTKDVKEKNKDGVEEVVSMRLRSPIVKAAYVFNFEQINGVPPLQIDENIKNWNPIEIAEKIITSSGASIIHKTSNSAYYDPRNDKITLPIKEQFKDAKGYYGTALHELAHWTGHKSRLDRNTLHGGHIDQTLYAKEELKAEIASYFLAMKTGIPNNIEQNAAYVSSWIKALENDPNEIYKASKDADIISRYLIGDDEMKKGLIEKHTSVKKDKEVER